MNAIENILNDELIAILSGLPADRVKKVKIGTGLKTANDFIGAFNEAHKTIDIIVGDIFNESVFLNSISQKEKTLNVVFISNLELGFPKGAQLQETKEKACSIGLLKCTAEIGPQLCLQLADCPAEDFLVGMDSIYLSDIENEYHVFLVTNGLELDVRDGYGDTGYVSDVRFCFALPEGGEKYLSKN